MASKYDTAWLSEDTGDIHTPKCRMVWPTLLEPRSMKNVPDSKPKFSVTLLIPKSANIDALKKGLVDVALGKFGKEWQKKKLLLPLLKTDDNEKLSEYAEAFPWLLRCSANAAFCSTFVYGPNAQKFEGDASEIYSGRWAVVAGNMYAYDNVSKGASFGLNRIQLLDHDEAIAGGRVATNAASSSRSTFSGTNFDVAGSKGGMP